MKEAQERKKRFVILLQLLLDQCDGIKGKLAQQLSINPSTLTPWLQGKIDPASLEILVFNRIATLADLTPDCLAQRLRIIQIEKQQKASQEQLKKLIEQMLITQSREQLGMRLGVSQHTVSNWMNPERNVHPGKMPVSTFAAVAIERGWTIERLLSYLNLNKNQEIEEDLLALIQSQTKQLSLPNRIKLLSWLSGDFEKVFSNLNLGIINTKEDFSKFNNLTILTILEQEDLTIASNYFSNLVEYLNFQAKNIKIATIPKLPQSLADIDILIFDINTADSPSIQLIEDLTFNGNIIIFADAIALPLIRDRISSVVSGIFAKPVDWSAKQIFHLFSK